MAQHPSSLGDLFAALRESAQAESVMRPGGTGQQNARPRRPGTVEAMVLALIIRLCTELEQLFSRWQANGIADQAPAIRLTRYAKLPFRPRAERVRPLPLWVISLPPGPGPRMRPSARPRTTAPRAHPPRNAPH